MGRGVGGVRDGGRGAVLLQPRESRDHVAGGSRDQLIDQLIDHFIDQLIDQLIDQFIDQLIDQFIDQSIDGVVLNSGLCGQGAWGCGGLAPLLSKPTKPQELP